MPVFLDGILQFDHPHGDLNVAIHRVCPIAVLAVTTLALQLHAAEPATAKSRKFEFHYGATINGLSPGAKARIWVPVAGTNYEQDVKVLDAKLPGEYRTTQDRGGYGNKAYFCEATADAKGEIPIDVKYLV